MAQAKGGKKLRRGPRHANMYAAQKVRTARNKRNRRVRIERRQLEIEHPGDEVLRERRKVRIKAGIFAPAAPQLGFATIPRWESEQSRVEVEEKEGRPLWTPLASNTYRRSIKGGRKAKAARAWLYVDNARRKAKPLDTQPPPVLPS